MRFLPCREFPPIPQYVPLVREREARGEYFSMGETVSDIWSIVTRITRRHVMVSPCRVYPEFRAERYGGTWRSSFI